MKAILQRVLATVVAVAFCVPAGSAAEQSNTSSPDTGNSVQNKRGNVTDREDYRSFVDFGGSVGISISFGYNLYRVKQEADGFLYVTSPYSEKKAVGDLNFKSGFEF